MSTDIKGLTFLASTSLMGYVWLSAKGFIDFAGSTVIHSVGGWVALAGAILLGPRIGKYNKDGSANVIGGHNVPLAALSVFILWFRWFGFNMGSTTAGTNLNIAVIAVTTNLATVAGAVTAMITIWMQFGKPDSNMTLNGALAGLVAITAGCANVSPMSSIIFGGLAGVLVVLSVQFFNKVLRVDDPVGAISVQGVCGTFGTLAVGFFTQQPYGSVNGLFFGGGFGPIMTQLVRIVPIFAWTILGSLILFSVIKATMGGFTCFKRRGSQGFGHYGTGMESYSWFQIFSIEN